VLPQPRNPPLIRDRSRVISNPGTLQDPRERPSGYCSAHLPEWPYGL